MVVQGISAKDGFVKIIGCPGVVIGFVLCDIIGFRITFGTDQLSRQVGEFSVFQIIDRRWRLAAGDGMAARAGIIAMVARTARIAEEFAIASIASRRIRASLDCARRSMTWGG